MADWQERVQSMIIGFVFAYMVMKLFSVISSFRAGNLRVTRASDEEGTLLVPSEIVELAPADEQSVPLIGTDEETEADGGDELEERAHDSSSSSSSDSEAEDVAVPVSRPREIDSVDEPTVSEVEFKDEELETKKEEEVETKKGEEEETKKGEDFETKKGEDFETEKGEELETKKGDELETKNGEELETKKEEEVESKKDNEVEDVAEKVEKTESKDISTPGEQSLKILSKEAGGGGVEEAFEDENETDDWEGVETTELEKQFGAASTYAETMAALSGVNPFNEAMLQLHAFYKVATEGPCSTSQPSAFQPTARAKWNEWQKLGSMTQEEAMEKYIAVVNEINPTWFENYQKSKESAKESIKRKDGDFSQSSGIMDALPVSQVEMEATQSTDGRSPLILAANHGKLTQ